MFDIDCEEDSFCDMLYHNGIETFTFDIPPCCHEDVIKTVNAVVEENDIKNIMGYSYGCIPAANFAQQNKLKTLILLDPFCNTNPVPNIEKDDVLEYTRENVQKVISSTYMNEHMRISYLSSLDEVFTAPKYPKLTSMRVHSAYTNEFFLSSLQSENTFVALTGSPTDRTLSIYRKFVTKVYSKASHWILLEDARKELCDDVCALLK